MSKQAEKPEVSMLESEDLTRAILENSPDSLGLLDAAGCFLLINETCRNSLAVNDLSAARGKEWRVLWPESARPQVDKAIATAKTGGRGRFRGWCATANGEPKFWDVIVTRLPNGGTAQFLTVSRDITDIKRMEDALRRSARSTALTSEAAAELLRSEDPQVVIEDICRKAMADLDCQFFFNFLLEENAGPLRINAFAGVSEEEARKFEKLDHGEVLSGRVVGVCESASVCNARDLPAELHDSYGVTAYCSHPLMAQGRVFGILSFGSRTRSEFSESELETMETLSQYVSMAIARAQMERALRESDKRKDEFIAVLAHELRNPLAAIHNGFNVLNRAGSAVMPQLRPMLDRQLHLLIRLVDDLLDVARIKTGKIELKKQRVDLVKVINQSLEAAEPWIRSRDQKVGVNLPSETLIVEGDPARLMQVFANLLDNAAKYTSPNGRIDVTATGDIAKAVVSVRDSGSGIPNDKLEAIFDLFNQSNCRPHDSRKGLGVGLTLARGLIEQHGGKLEARSGGPGRGSEFLVHLPRLHRAQDHEDGLEAVTNWVSPIVCRVLVVDDDRDVADSLVMFLRYLGAEARVVYCGEEALKLLTEFKPHLVLLDIGMPGMDGYETARRIRELPEGRGLRLATLSGWEINNESAIKAGFDQQFVKPITVGELQQAISEVVTLHLDASSAG